MKYLYYPGCSLGGTAVEYDISTRALMAAVGAELLDLPDWNCCGASAAAGKGLLLSLALPARNLSIAEAMEEDDALLVPCSSCYLNLKRVTEVSRKEPGLFGMVNAVLEEEGKRVKGRVEVRHLLDVLAGDLGEKGIGDLVNRPLDGLRVAPYYGCQCLRPYPVFDDPERPVSMEPIIRALGASVHPWDMGGRCCGASHMNTKPEVGLKLTGAVLRGAEGADAVVTVCPMCQMNLEGYQREITRDLKGLPPVTVLYLPQLVGLALGLDRKAVGLERNLSITESFFQKLPVG